MHQQINDFMQVPIYARLTEAASGGCVRELPWPLCRQGREHYLDLCVAFIWIVLPSVHAYHNEYAHESACKTPSIFFPPHCMITSSWMCLSQHQHRSIELGYNHVFSRYVHICGSRLYRCTNPNTDQHGGDDPHCLIKWNPDGTGGEFASKDTPELCTGEDVWQFTVCIESFCVYMYLYIDI